MTAPAGLVAYRGQLTFADGAREQDTRTVVAARPHAHPTLSGAEIGVLEQLEVERADVEREGLVIVPDGDGELSDALWHGLLERRTERCDKGPSGRALTPMPVT
jgi:hypothetical protein